MRVDTSYLSPSSRSFTASSETRAASSAPLARLNAGRTAACAKNPRPTTAKRTLPPSPPLPLRPAAREASSSRRGREPPPRPGGGGRGGVRARAARGGGGGGRG